MRKRPRRPYTERLAKSSSSSSSGGTNQGKSAAERRKSFHDERAVLTIVVLEREKSFRDRAVFTILFSPFTFPFSFSFPSRVMVDIDASLV